MMRPFELFVIPTKPDYPAFFVCARAVVLAEEVVEGGVESSSSPFVGRWCFLRQVLVAPEPVGRQE